MTTTYSVRANRMVAARAYGGFVRIAGARLSFEPHGLERKLGGSDSAIERPLSSIRGIHVVGRSWSFPRRRLALSFDDGELVMLVVPKPADVATTVREHARLSGVDVDVTDF